MNEVIKVVLIPLGITLLGTIIIELIRKIRRDYKITCEELSLRKYREKESDNVKISLSYKEEKVGDSLCIMTVRLTNKGRKDIPFNQVFEDKIEIRHKSYKIIDILIAGQSDKVSAKIDKTDLSEWLLSWGILKKKEIIDLKIVAVVDEESERKDYLNSETNNIEFVFRGNNINKIESVGLSRVKLLYYLFLSACSVLIMLLALFPLVDTVRYDVIVDNIKYNDVYINYNAYNHSYVLSSGWGVTVCKTPCIDNIEVANQSFFSNTFITVSVIVLVYIVISFILMRLISKRKKHYILNWFRRSN